MVEGDVVASAAFRWSVAAFRAESALAPHLTDDRLSGMRSTILAPSVLPVDKVGQFDRGHHEFRDGGISAMDRAVRLVCDRFPRARLFVELTSKVPLGGPDPDTVRMIIESPDGMFASCPVDTGPLEVRRTLNAHDPTFSYFAVLIGIDGGVPEFTCPARLLSRGSILLGLLVGVYDGEGFIVTATPDRLRSECDDEPSRGDE